MGERAGKSSLRYESPHHQSCHNQTLVPSPITTNLVCLEKNSHTGWIFFHWLTLDTPVWKQVPSAVFHSFWSFYITLCLSLRYMNLGLFEPLICILIFLWKASVHGKISLRLKKINVRLTTDKKSYFNWQIHAGYVAFNKHWAKKGETNLAVLEIYK
jgi:hypothetical protein